MWHKADRTLSKVTARTLTVNTFHHLFDKHYIPQWLTFAGADEEVAVGSDSTEGQVYYRPGVPGAGERRLSHRHGPPAE